MAIILTSVGIALCIFLSAVFSASEMALSGCNPLRLEGEAKKGSKKSARALKLIDKFDDTLSTILVANNLVNIAASSLGTVLIILVAGNTDYNWLVTLIVTVLVIIFGETIPKIAAKKLANSASANIATLILILYYLLWPLNYVVVKLVGFVTKNIGKSNIENDDDEAVEELQSIIDTAEDEGVLDSDQSEIVSAAIDFQDISAEQVMTARVDVQAINIDDEPCDILADAINCNYSRMPVYRDSMDNILGIVHLNHLLKAYAENKNVDISTLLLKPCYVYKTTKLPQVLNNLKRAKQHLAIVTDEYSGTLGVISMEDVLEQIVGEIWDETDEIEEEVVQNANGEMIVDGDMSIDDFLELFEISPDNFECDSSTVGGWTIESFGDFPNVGDSFTYENITIRVLEMDERRVEKIMVIKKV